MKPLFMSLGFAALGLLLISAAPEEKPKGGTGQGGQVEPAVVPPYLFNVWLCRPGAESVTVSVLAWDDMEAFIEYGDGLKTTPVKLKAGEPQNIVLGGLKPDTSYNYRLTYRRAGGEAVQDAMRSFLTQRKAGSTFSFVMQADSHLEHDTDVRVYQQTLANMLADKHDRNTKRSATKSAAARTACPFSWFPAITKASAVIVPTSKTARWSTVTSSGRDGDADRNLQIMTLP